MTGGENLLRYPRPDLATSKDAARSAGNWWLTGVLLIAGFGLLYWAGEQFVATTTQISETTDFQEVSYALWLLTLVSSGLVFGLAILAAQRRTASITWAALVWALIPLAVVTYVYLILAGVSVPDLPEEAATFIFTPGVQTASSLLVGLFMAAALGPLVLPSGRRH